MTAQQPEAHGQMGDLIMVDDNTLLSQEHSLVLQGAGWSVRCADDGESLRAQVARKVPDIVVLDLNLPGEDGISLCEWLRRTYPRIGIVMLTARVRGSDRTEGYVAGADCYLTKPTRPEEFLAVARNLFRRSQLAAPSSPQDYAPPWTLHVKAIRLLSPQLDMLNLTPTECLLLHTLADNNGMCSYAELLDKTATSGLQDPMDKARLDVVVSRLRKKLAQFSAQSPEISTSHGKGYFLTCPLAVKE